MGIQLVCSISHSSKDQLAHMNWNSWLYRAIYVWVWVWLLSWRIILPLTSVLILSISAESDSALSGVWPHRVLLYCTVWFLYCTVWRPLPMVWATSADPTTGKATKDGLWCKWGKSNGELCYLGRLALLCRTTKNFKMDNVPHEWNVTKITEVDDDHWRPALACLLTTQLANKPQPSFGHAASLCEHLSSIFFYWLQFLSKACCQQHRKVLGTSFGVETTEDIGMHRTMQWITPLKEKTHGLLWNLHFSEQTRRRILGGKQRNGSKAWLCSGGRGRILTLHLSSLLAVRLHLQLTGAVVGHLVTQTHTDIVPPKVCHKHL